VGATAASSPSASLGAMSLSNGSRALLDRRPLAARCLPCGGEPLQYGHPPIPQESAERPSSMIDELQHTFSYRLRVTVPACVLALIVLPVVLYVTG